MNVLQLISSLEVGGAEKLLIDLLVAARDDERVNFIVIVMNQAVNPEMREKLERQGVTVYFLDRPEGKMHPRYWMQIMRVIHRHQIDIVHAHNSGSKLWAMLCKLAQPRLKLVFTIHDTVPTRFSSGQRLLHRMLIDQHIAISRSVEALCEREGFSRRTQIYNGIDLQPFQNPNRVSWKARLARHSFESEALRIVQVGRMYYPKKGQDLLVHAVKQCRDAGLNVKATLMGGVHAYSEQSFTELKALVQSLGLAEHIEFLVNRTDVPTVLEQADLFVLPSRYEGLGLVVLEAMAAGLPVVASAVDGPAELIASEKNGLLFEPDNVENLYQQIRRLYENPALADQLTTEAASFVTRFDIHLMKNQYCDLYESLLPAAIRQRQVFNRLELSLGEP